MHRSSSYSSSARASDECLVNFSPSTLKVVDSSEDLLLPIYNKDAISDEVLKKDLCVNPTAGERALHLIPMVLILTGLILWWFSHPVKLH